MPAARAAVFREATATHHVSAPAIHRPVGPVDHSGAAEPVFDALFGAEGAALIDTTL